MKRVLFVILMIIYTLGGFAQSQMISHVVSSGETLYSISRHYSVTVNDILNANPGLTEYIMAGQTIKVPSISAAPELQKQNPCKLIHVVQKKETIYGIARQYGISEEELIAANPIIQDGKKLKKGSELCIPYNDTEKKDYKEQQSLAMEKLEAERQEALVKYPDVIKVAFIAPFGLSDSRRSQEAKKMTDFYKGFLMAVDTLKHKGISCEVYTYEEPASDGTAATILAQPMLKHVNLIIGPFKPGNAAQVARFAVENNIAMVVPTSTKGYDFSNYRTVYEFSAPTNVVFDNVYSKFAEKFSTNNIIFVSMDDSRENGVFITRFKETLKERNIKFKVININEFEKIASVLSADKSNVFIPSSSSENALKILAGKFKANSKEMDGVRIRLFGYPEWQTYTKQKDFLKKYSATFYTTFFSNPSNPNVRRFNRSFTNWFQNPQVASFPKYGELGYDIGYFFINSLKQSGTRINTKAPARYEGMQSTLNFVRKTEMSAAINQSMMFVRFNSDDTFEVER